MRETCFSVRARRAGRGRLQCVQNIASSRFSFLQYAHFFIVTRLSLFRTTNAI
jgi:hypothetical protein